MQHPLSDIESVDHQELAVLLLCCQYSTVRICLCKRAFGSCQTLNRGLCSRLEQKLSTDFSLEQQSARKGHFIDL